jgi:hypothetical protein
MRVYSGGDQAWPTIGRLIVPVLGDVIGTIAFCSTYQQKKQ